MLLTLRKLRQGNFSGNKVRKYLLYALGEMVLIVIGILIALQIDNWNTAKRERETLQSYLNSIARNIGSDLQLADEVLVKRRAAYEAASRTLSFIAVNRRFTVPEIMFANHALMRAQELLSLESNTSGFEALKSSGSLEQLQGTDMETLLYEYYETVRRIANAEVSHNDYVRTLSLQIISRWPVDMEPWEFELAAALAPDRFETLQSSYRELLNDVTTISLYRRARAIGGLLNDYERLRSLGAAYRQMVESGTMGFDDTIAETLRSNVTSDSGLGHAAVISDGQVAWHHYDLRTPNSLESRIIGRSDEQTGADRRRDAFHFKSFEQLNDRLHLDYPGGADWASISIVVRGSSAGRPSLDFSGFDTLVLELKGDTGGETILVNLKDKDDPDDGSQTNIELTLGDEWKTFEIDLADFETADKSKLHLVLGFLFFEEAQSFSVRNVTYVKSP